MEQTVGGVDPLTVGTTSHAGSKLRLSSAIGFSSSYLTVFDVEFEDT
jgi:hypothetical protein